MNDRRSAAGRLKTILKKFTDVFGARNKYRRERHYMRGPGPKSQMWSHPTRDVSLPKLK